MKGFLMIIYVLIPLSLFSQQSAEYNRKGDDAMKRLDYSDAKMWYEEGVARCDTYSINRLTTIWLSKKQMRPSMRSLMNKCLNCLTVKATDDDANAISKLILYYTEGIGTPINKELATYWQEYQDKLLRGRQIQLEDSTSLSYKRRMEFFIGYSYSIESPYGIMFGGVGYRLGWYVRFKTNMSFMSYTGECDNKGEIIGFPNEGEESYEPDVNRSSKTNSISGTGGLIVECLPWLYASVGLGYGKRVLLHPFVTHSYENYDDSQSFWCKNIDASYEGVAAELDLMIKITPSIFFDVGCNTINFKYVDLNVGVGVFF